MNLRLKLILALAIGVGVGLFFDNDFGIRPEAEEALDSN